MAESTLSVTYAELKIEVGVFLGFERDSQVWSNDETADVEAIIKRGLRQFYAPPPITGQDVPHIWSFLKPVTTLIIWPDVAVNAAVTVTGVHDAGVTTITATSASFYASMAKKSIVITDTGAFTITEYVSSTVIKVSGDATCSDKTFSIASEGSFTLPDNFGTIEGGFTFDKDDDRYTQIKVTSESNIRSFRQRDYGPAVPKWAAIRPLASDGSGGQRYEVVFERDPDSVYNLWYQYSVLSEMVSDSNPYPLGGASHSETILESCLSIAEQRMEDNEGLHYKKFLERLAASIQYDRRASNVEVLGYNADNSDGQRTVKANRMGGNVVTYEGVEYD